MTIVGAGLAMIAASFGLAAAAVDGATVSHSAPATPFGGPTSVRVEHVGRIEVDLEMGRPGDLRRTQCAGATATTTCYVSSVD